MIATARLTALPVFIRLPGIWKDHFQPVGLAVWTTVYSTPLCRIGDNDPAAKKISDKFPNKIWDGTHRQEKVKKPGLEKERLDRRRVGCLTDMVKEKSNRNIRSSPVSYLGNWRGFAEEARMSRKSLQKQADRADNIADQTVDEELKENLRDAAREYRLKAASDDLPPKLKRW